MVLLREEPDSEEMNDIAWGVLFDQGSEDMRSVMEVAVGDRTVSGDEFSKALYCAHDQLLREEEGFAGFLRFARLYLHAQVDQEEVQGARMTIELRDFVACIERNFNGKSKRSLSAVVSKFLRLLRCLSWAPYHVRRRYVIRHFTSSAFSQWVLAAGLPSWFLSGLKPRHFFPR